LKDPVTTGGTFFNINSAEVRASSFPYYSNYREAMSYKHREAMRYWDLRSRYPIAARLGALPARTLPSPPGVPPALQAWLALLALGQSLIASACLLKSAAVSEAKTFASHKGLMHRQIDFGGRRRAKVFGDCLGPIM
jgi:hypothetical protein